ncbi:hypothetical protein BCEN4_740133 [Burkholderia cenocepacia]|nr:hypothetical protein BCEN4_740133 [Burkholderia cenocepacia]
MIWGGFLAVNSWNMLVQEIANINEGRLAIFTQLNTFLGCDILSPFQHFLSWLLVDKLFSHFVCKLFA